MVTHYENLSYIMKLDSSSITPDGIKTKIRQRRSQMLVHSRLYYIMDENIVSDEQWQKWANELRDLQLKYPQYCNIGFYDREFATWNGDTGAFLPLKDPYVVSKTQQVINQWHKENEKQNNV